jgi:hypothetical protein
MSQIGRVIATGGQAFRATNTRVARLNRQVGDSSDEEVETDNLLLIFSSSPSRPDCFVSREGSRAESAVTGLADRCRFSGEGWADEVSR